MKEDTNFALIIVGVVAIVAVVGLLNFSGGTGKATGGTSKSVILTETGSIFYCASDCNNECTKTQSCIGIKTRTGTKAAATAYCPNNLNYDAEGTYYMHYFCG